MVCALTCLSSNAQVCSSISCMCLSAWSHKSASLCCAFVAAELAPVGLPLCWCALFFLSNLRSQCLGSNQAPQKNHRNRAFLVQVSEKLSFYISNNNLLITCWAQITQIQFLMSSEHNHKSRNSTITFVVALARLLQACRPRGNPSGQQAFSQTSRTRDAFPLHFTAGASAFSS